MRLILSPSHTFLPPFKTPATGRIMRFLRDEELSIFGYKSRVVDKNYKLGALPATVALDGKPDFMPLSREWQELWFECFKWQAGGTMTHDQLLEAWRSVTMNGRAFTDQHTRENGYRDWILGVNMTGKDMEQRSLSTAGNLIDVISGGSRVSFLSLDVSQPPPKIETIWGNPTLVWWAAETNRLTKDGNPWFIDDGTPKYDINGRWPQLGKLGVPFLNISWGGVQYVNAERVENVSCDVLYTPYNRG